MTGKLISETDQLVSQLIKMREMPTETILPKAREIMGQMCDMTHPPRMKEGFIVQVTERHISDLVQFCNMVSINLLKKDQFDDALWLLRKSKQLVE